MKIRLTMDRCAWSWHRSGRTHSASLDLIHDQLAFLMVQRETISKASPFTGQTADQKFLVGVHKVPSMHRGGSPGRRRRVLSTFFVIGLVVSAVIGVLISQSLHAGCLRFGEPEHCGPADFFAIAWAGFLVVIYLAVATPLVLAYRWLVKRSERT